MGHHPNVVVHEGGRLVAVVLLLLLLLLLLLVMVMVVAVKRGRLVVRRRDAVADWSPAEIAGMAKC